MASKRRTPSGFASRDRTAGEGRDRRSGSSVTCPTWLHGHVIKIRLGRLTPLPAIVSGMGRTLRLCDADACACRRRSPPPSRCARCRSCSPAESPPSWCDSGRVHPNPIFQQTPSPSTPIHSRLLGDDASWSASGDGAGRVSRVRGKGQPRRQPLQSACAGPLHLDNSRRQLRNHTRIKFSRSSSDNLALTSVPSSRSLARSRFERCKSRIFSSIESRTMSR